MTSRVTIACICLILSMGTAQATGGIGCEAKDKVLEFSAESAISHGLGGGFLNFQADLNIRLKDTPDDLRHLKLDQNHLVHHWIDGRELKLLLYWERNEGSHAYVELVVETKRKSDEDTSKGTYHLSIFTVTDNASKLVEKRGAVTCSVE